MFWVFTTKPYCSLPSAQRPCMWKVDGNKGGRKVSGFSGAAQGACLSDWAPTTLCWPCKCWQMSAKRESESRVFSPLSSNSVRTSPSQNRVAVSSFLPLAHPTLPSGLALLLCPSSRAVLSASCPQAGFLGNKERCVRIVILSTSPDSHQHLVWQMKTRSLFRVSISFSF